MEKSEVERNLDLFIAAMLPESIRRGLNKACTVVEKDAKKKCPKDDGTLRASITHTIEGVTGYVGSNVEYAPYVHQGTGVYAKEGNGRKKVPWYWIVLDGGALNMKYGIPIKTIGGIDFYYSKGQKPHPFLQEAIDENKDKILDCFKGMLK